MINTISDQIEERLQQVETLIHSCVDNNHSALAMALDQLVASGGKRLRPRIALLMGSMLGADPERLINLAAAIEMLHTATLVHDDLIDNATLRRGQATLNAHWSSAATTLTGDFAFATAAQLAYRAGSFPVMGLFTETLTNMVSQEIIQLSSKQGISHRDDYYRWIQAKTASLLELATGAAALLSPVDESMVNAARKFGYKIGMAFQIIDDVLDFSSDSSTLGKPVGNDLRQGTVTLPALYYLETHPNDPTLISVIHRNGHSEADLDQLIQTIKHSRAIERATRKAEKFVESGLATLEFFPPSPERAALTEIAQQMISRKS